jgi:hypothetical protein
MRATLIAALVLEAATAAHAQAQPQPYAQPQPDARARDEGWALGGGVFGLVAAASVVALAGASEATRQTQVPSLPLGVTATVLFTASVPVVAAGAASARHGNRALGVRALRVLGWIAYGCALAEATTLIGMGAAKVTPPEGVIISTGLLGTASLGMMSIDALVSRAQAREAQRSTVGLAATF